MLPKLPTTADSGGERNGGTSCRLSSLSSDIVSALLASRRCERCEGRDDAEPPWLCCDDGAESLPLRDDGTRRCEGMEWREPCWDAAGLDCCMTGG